jgi:hypothetical protein
VAPLLTTHCKAVERGRVIEKGEKEEIKGGAVGESFWLTFAEKRYGWNSLQLQGLNMLPHGTCRERAVPKAQYECHFVFAYGDCKADEIRNQHLGFVTSMTIQIKPFFF